MGVVDDNETADERSLVDRARRDPDAFAELYRRYVGRVHAFHRRRTGSVEVADDLTSATFERALRSLDTFRWRRGGFAPWLFRIAANLVTDHYRREGRSRTERGQVAAAQHLGSGSVPAVDYEDDAELRAALARISPRYQRVLGLRYLADLSNEDAARALGVPRTTMPVLVHRASAALRRELERMEVAP